MKLFIIYAVVVTVLSRPQQPVPELKVHFIYYPSPGEQKEIEYNNTRSLFSSNLKPATKTIFIMDGFTSFLNTPMHLQTKDTFSVQPDMNVIIVDWSAFSGYYATPLESQEETIAVYTDVLFNKIPQLGSDVADFIQFIHENNGISYENVTIIAHSLGCHAASAIGRNTIAKYYQTIGRIVAEDPAFQFSIIDAPFRLRIGDAANVEVYNTNRNGYGDMYPATGDVTIYVNGGDNQPCQLSPNKEAVASRLHCNSHAYSYKLYNYLASNSTIKACPCRGVACLCQECSFECSKDGISIGPHIPANAQGSYHVKTGVLN